MGTVNNVMVAGPITVYTATASTARPADTIAKGTAWGGSWTDAGFTQGGAQFELSGDDATVDVDQHLSSVQVFPVSEEAKLTVRLAEATLTNILLGRGGMGSVTAETNESVIYLGTQAWHTLKAVGIEGRAPGATSSSDKYRRIILHRAKVERSVDIGFTKEGAQMVEVTFVGLVDSTQSAGKEVGVIVDDS
jgi:hypothetical protein